MSSYSSSFATFVLLFLLGRGVLRSRGFPCGRFGVTDSTLLEGTRHVVAISLVARIFVLNVLRIQVVRLSRRPGTRKHGRIFERDLVVQRVGVGSGKALDQSKRFGLAASAHPVAFGSEVGRLYDQ